MLQKVRTDMLMPAERRELLVERLHNQGKLVSRDMALELGVSDDIIRRDLRDMAAAGLCQRVYGGALPASPAVVNYEERTQVQPDAEHHVAKVAVGLLAPEATLLLDGGTTALEVARALPLSFEGTIVTHSVTVAAALLDHAGVEIIVLGGRLFKHSAVTCGPTTAAALEGIRADFCFLGVTGVHPQTGLTTDDYEEAAIKRLLAQRAAETYILASSEKIGAASRFTVLSLRDVSGIITDPSADPSLLRELQEQGNTILS
jgi:DeoR/GlpR family transcriptional regulator of sugar metabolism